MSSDSLEFFRATPASVERYLDFLVATHEIRLRDLAHRIAASGGPIEGLDGSVASLVPLWQWFQDELIAGYPGVPADARPSHARFLKYSRVKFPEAQYVGEEIGHYLAEVIFRAFPGAVPALQDDRNRDYQEPGVRTPGGKFVDVFSIGTRSARASMERERSRTPTRLIWMIEENLGESSRWSPPATGKSILTGYLDAPPLSLDDPVRVPPPAEPIPVVDEGRWSMSDVGAMLAVRPGPDPDDPATWKPINERVLAGALNREGWRLWEGGPVTAHLLKDESTQIFWGDGEVRAMLTMVVAKRRLRAMPFDITTVNDAEWHQLESGLNRVAAEIGGRFGTFEDF